MAEEGGARAELGRVIVQVQEDLLQLKEKLRDISHDWEETDVRALEAAIERTESGLRKHAEKYLNARNRSVLTISQTSTGNLRSRQISKWGVPLATSQKEITFPQISTIATKPGKSLMQMSSGSKHKLSMMVKILYDPRNACNRSLLRENYGVSQPLVNRRKKAPAPTQKLAKGVTVGNLLVAPRSFHLKKASKGMLVSGRDAEKGLLSLIERGLIPRAARIAFEKPFVLPKPLPVQQKPSADEKVEHKTKVCPPQYQKLAPISTSTSMETKEKGNLAPPPSCISVVQLRKSRAEITEEVQHQELPKTPETTIAQAYRKPFFDFDIPVQNGVIDFTSADFLGFKQSCCLFWGSVRSLVEQVAKRLKDYAVPSAIIKGKKVLEMVPDFELNQRLTRDELLSVIEDASVVRKILCQPGQRYKGPEGTNVAATQIQAMWRGYKFRKAYIQFRHRQWASGVIALSWLVHVHLGRVRKMLKESRQRHLENFYIRVKHLAANWKRIRTSRRTIIHIPSLGYAASVRDATSDFPIDQGSQIGRLCEIQDPNVDVIYVSPIQLSEEMLQYHNKVLGLQAALKSGDPKDVADLQDRFKILTPEAVNRFPSRPMSLATFLKYSPKTIKRIKNLILGTDAYIVGGFPNQDDLEVADMLDVPILGPNPEVARLYSSKSGSKRLFTAVPVPVPPGQYDIYSRQQLVEVLTHLIIDYPEVKRWVFKMDNEFGGNGTAYCDIAQHLKCYPWILKESKRYGSKTWMASWAHEPALAKISQELPGLLAQHAQAVNEKRFPTWGKFLQTFVSQGGIIEAFPPSDSITNLTVDMLIEPTGEITMVSCGDQFHAESPFRSSGTTFPQASVEPQVLNMLCFKIGEACKSRGVVGYFSIDFVTFIHPHTMSQQVWAIDLDLHYSDHLALTKVLLYITNGTLNCGLSHFQVQLIPKKPKTLHPKKEPLPAGPLVSRYVIMSSSITHANLSLIYYNVFLQMCKAHGIGYDVQQKEGTLFTLFEDQKRCRFGMITIGEHLEGVLTTFAQHLFMIYQELSAPNMHAETNFKGAVQDIEKIMGIAEQNKVKFEEEEATSVQTSME